MPRYRIGNFVTFKDMLKSCDLDSKFFARTQPLVSGRLVLVLDADRQSLMQGRRPDDPVRRRFTELARTAGAQMVDLEPVFAAHFATSRMALDLGPQDGHFNPLATRLVAAAIAQELRVEHAP